MHHITEKGGDTMLLTNTLAGGGYLLLLLFLCAGGTVGFRLVRRALREREKRSAKPAQPEKPAQDEEKKEPPQKVYYLVEKKRTRPKKQYGEPKRITFDGKQRSRAGGRTETGKTLRAKVVSPRTF